MESIRAIMPFRKHKSNFETNVKRDSVGNSNMDTRKKQANISSDYCAG
jgi:hypothetical protein